MFKKFATTLLILGVTSIPAICAEVQESLISTEATVNREVSPDTARIRFHVENSGLNLADLKKKNDKIVNDAIVAIKAKLDKDESIKTITYSVNNIYSYKDKIRVFQKYQVRNGFEVKLKDLDKISDIINLAMANDVKIVGSLDFSIEDTEKVCNEMMAEAVKTNQKRVQYITNAAGIALGKVKSINPYCSLSHSHVPQNRIMKAYNAAGASMDTVSEVQMETIEPGTINARASVNMMYYLK